jgi:hypothetical protein
MIEKYSHYLMFSNTRPACADEAGCLKWREGFEKLDKQEWTESETWIDKTERIAKLHETLINIAKNERPGGQE